MKPNIKIVTYLDIQMVRNHIFRNLDVSPHAHHMIVVSGLHLYVSSSHSFRNTDADMTYFLLVRRLRRKEKLLSRFGCIFLLPRVRVDSTRWGVCESTLSPPLSPLSTTSALLLLFFFFLFFSGRIWKTKTLRLGY